MINWIVLAAAAAMQPPPPDCGNADNQAEMNMCAARDFEMADRELNIAYQEAIAGARADDVELDREFDKRPGSEEVLRQGQRAWVTFRDAHCTLVGYQEARGGSMEPLSFNSCRASMTRARTAQLRGDPAPAQ